MSARGGGVHATSQLLFLGLVPGEDPEDVLAGSLAMAQLLTQGCGTGGTGVSWW